MKREVTYYLVRFHFEDGTTEDYHETTSEKEADKLVAYFEDYHPEWHPRVLVTKQLEEM